MKTTDNAEFDRGYLAAEAQNESNWLEVAASAATFVDDVPDSDFQRGYLAALKDRLRELLMLELGYETRPLPSYPPEPIRLGELGDEE